MKRQYKQLFIVFLLSSLSACAPSEERLYAGETVQSSGSACISEGTIRGYKVLNDSNLVITGRANQKYHMELMRRAPGLRSTWQIGFASPTGRICSKFSDLVVDDNLGPDRVRIRSIRKLTDEDYEDLMYRFGKAGEQKPPEPEDVDGAEVEELD